MSLLRRASSSTLDAIVARARRSMESLCSSSSSRAPTIAVGMSGGVDSAVAAWALKACGARVVGVLMRNWDACEETGGRDDFGFGGCAHGEDRKSAKACAEKLGIELTEVDFTREYWNDVFEPYLSAFDDGATPNPDLECNRMVKFGSLLEHATERMGADYLATGHYARIERCGDGEVRLLRGVDGSKDQSYFLASVRGEALKRACFPLGETLKTETREAARTLGLTSAAERRSSAGICFIGRRPFGEFIGEYIAPKEGAFVDVETSQPIRDAPRHRGLASYTVGQRAKIPGASRPWFVVGKNVAANVVYVASGSDHDALFSSSCVVADEFWVAGRRPSAPTVSERFHAKARYASPLIPIDAHGVDQSNRDDAFKPSVFSAAYAPRSTNVPSFRVSFDRPERALTPGQALVVYDGDVCLGGGVVERVGETSFETKKNRTD